jgi:hypothetical protein
MTEIEPCQHRSQIHVGRWVRCMDCKAVLHKNEPYTPPEVATLEPTPSQLGAINYVVLAAESLALLSQGRGSGKSTARALIAQAILNGDDGDPLYEVRPITR